MGRIRFRAIALGLLLVLVVLSLVLVIVYERSKSPFAILLGWFATRLLSLLLTHGARSSVKGK